VAAYGWQHEQRSSVERHKATYYTMRAAHPSLPSQLVVQARVRAGEALTSGIKRKAQGRRCSCPKATRVPIRYDARTYRLLDGAASLASVAGRQVVPFAAHPHARTVLARATGFDSADLNEARTIAAKHVQGGRSALGGLSVNQPIVGERVASQHAATGKPPSLAGGR